MSIFTIGLMSSSSTFYPNSVYYRLFKVLNNCYKIPTLVKLSLTGLYFSFTEKKQWQHIHLVKMTPVLT